MSVGERIKIFRNAINMKQGELSDLLGIHQSSLARYEKDASDFTFDKINKFYDLGVNVNWLLTGEGEMFLSDMLKSNMPVSIKENKNTELIVKNSQENNISLATRDEDLVKIPLLDVKASAGLGFVNYQEDIKDYVGIPARFLGGYLPKNVALLFADGDSMEPIMHSGDLLLVSPKDKELISDRVYIIKVFDELRVKILIRKVNGNIIIKSENERYGSEEISPQEWTDNNIEIVGRVITVIHAQHV